MASAIAGSDHAATVVNPLGGTGGTAWARSSARRRKALRHHTLKKCTTPTTSATPPAFTDTVSMSPRPVVTSVVSHEVGEVADVEQEETDDQQLVHRMGERGVAPEHVDEEHFPVPAQGIADPEVASGMVMARYSR